MTPKEKAKYLVEKYYYYNDSDFDNSKQFALFVVDEILNEYWLHDILRNDYWEQVKKEINKL